MRRRSTSARHICAACRPGGRRRRPPPGPCRASRRGTASCRSATCSRATWCSCSPLRAAWDCRRSTMLRTLGARPLAVVGHESKRRFLIEQRGLAPDAVVVRDPRRFGAQLDAGAGRARRRRVSIACWTRCSGRRSGPRSTGCGPEGRYVLFGAADFMSRGARPNYLRLALDYLRRPRARPARDDLGQPQPAGLQPDLALGPRRAAARRLSPSSSGWRRGRRTSAPPSRSTAPRGDAVAAGRRDDRQGGAGGGKRPSRSRASCSR